MFRSFFGSCVRVFQSIFRIELSFSKALLFCGCATLTFSESTTWNRLDNDLSRLSWTISLYYYGINVCAVINLLWWCCNSLPNKSFGCSVRTVSEYCSASQEQNRWALHWESTEYWDFHRLEQYTEPYSDTSWLVSYFWAWKCCCIRDLGLCL